MMSAYTSLERRLKLSPSADFQYVTLVISSNDNIPCPVSSPQMLLVNDL